MKTRGPVLSLEVPVQGEKTIPFSTFSFQNRQKSLVVCMCVMYLIAVYLCINDSCIRHTSTFCCTSYLHTCICSCSHVLWAHTISSNISSLIASSRQELKDRQRLINIRDWHPLLLFEKKPNHGVYLKKTRYRLLYYSGTVLGNYEIKIFKNISWIKFLFGIRILYLFRIHSYKVHQTKI